MLPRREAARVLGVTENTVKQASSDLRFRWPARKLQSLQSLRESTVAEIQRLVPEAEAAGSPSLRGRVQPEEETHPREVLAAVSEACGCSARG